LVSYIGKLPTDLASLRLCRTGQIDLVDISGGTIVPPSSANGQWLDGNGYELRHVIVNRLCTCGISCHPVGMLVV
jgi:hypothetical protein